MEFTKEEKQAIKRIKFLIKEIKCECDICKLNVVTFKIILNLIDKQQKEIEEKNCLIDVLQHKIEELLDNKKINYIKPIDIPVHNYISKDKIKEKINELETLYNCNLDTAMTSYEMFVFVRSYIDKVKNILEELLEENK